MTKKIRPVLIIRIGKMEHKFCNISQKKPTYMIIVIRKRLPW